jgi:hypothetical protein
MRAWLRQTVFGVLAAGAVAFGALSADAQSRTRNDRALSSPGRGGVAVGHSAVSRLASGYAGHTGTLARPASGGAGPTVSYTLRGSSGGASPWAGGFSASVNTRAGGALATSFSAPTGGTAAMTSRMVAPVTGPRMGPVGNATGISAMFARSSPAGTFEEGPDGSLLATAVDIDDPNVVATFAPDDDSAYARHMQDGESAFRRQRYGTAFAQFESANRIGGDPESLLSMAHAKFAAGSYPSSAMYLRMVLREVPQLPRINFRPRGFYGDPTAYIRDMQRLDNFVVQFPDNADGALLKAYFSWFDPERGPTVALQAITAGLSQPNPPQATQALEAFLEGMLIVLQGAPDESEDESTASLGANG